MFDIVIIAVGKIKDDFYRDAFDQYLKRLTPYAKIKIEEVALEPFRGNSDKGQAKKKEGEKILRALAKHHGADIICLTEAGELMDSPTFAKWLNLKANKKIVFVIAGSLGFDQTIFKNVSGFLSLSTLTFPHELARVVLAEQLYRAISISKNKEYHY